MTLTEPQMWTALGILAATLVTTIAFLARITFRTIDGLSTDIRTLGSDLRTLGSDLRADFNGLRTEVQGIHRRIDQLDRDVQAIAKHVFRDDPRD